MNCVVNCHQIKPNTVSKECHHTKDKGHHPVLSITCHSVRLCMASQICKFLNGEKENSLFLYINLNRKNEKHNLERAGCKTPTSITISNMRVQCMIVLANIHKITSIIILQKKKFIYFLVVFLFFFSSLV